LVVIAVNNPSKAGDAKNLKDFTYIPAIIWALLMMCLVCWVSYQVYFLLPCFK
jgi:preprotein translocase subunit SecG